MYIPKTPQYLKYTSIMLVLLPCLSFAANDQVPTMLAAQTVDGFRLVAALLSVLVIILLLAWLIRKSGFIKFHHGDTIKVLAQLTLSNREKIVLVDAVGTQLLIGVTQQTVNTLHVFDENTVNPIAVDSNKKNFAGYLNRIMQQGKSK